MTTRKDILLLIGEDIYEVSKFIPNHPGEGIHDIYIRNFNRKNVTEEFEHYHFDSEPEDWLEKAKKNKFDPETGIYYVGPSFFKKRIPAYFHYLVDDEKGEKYMSQQAPKTFIVVFNSPESAILSYNKEDASYNQLELQRNKESSWIVANNPNIEDELKQANAISLEQLVEDIMVKRGYVAA